MEIHLGSGSFWGYAKQQPWATRPLLYALLMEMVCLATVGTFVNLRHLVINNQSSWLTPILVVLLVFFCFFWIARMVHYFKAGQGMFVFLEMVLCVVLSVLACFFTFIATILMFVAAWPAIDGLPIIERFFPVDGILFVDPKSTLIACLFVLSGGLIVNLGGLLATWFRWLMTEKKIKRVSPGY